jgi:hypothetical protein
LLFETGAGGGIALERPLSIFLEVVVIELEDFKDLEDDFLRIFEFLNAGMKVWADEGGLSKEVRLLLDVVEERGSVSLTWSPVDEMSSDTDESDRFSIG